MSAVFDDDKEESTEAEGETKDVKKEARFSLKDTVEDDVLKHYGKADRWIETGYIYKDGTRLDLSGKADGGTGGYRAIDHRDFLWDTYGEADMGGTEAMVEFMSRGNIRVMPESPGINLQVEPTEEQYRRIKSLIENLGWANKEFYVDFDNERGNTVANLQYEGVMSASEVISDIKSYFKEDNVPYKSALADFRQSLKLIDNYTEKQYNDFGWARVNEVLTVNENADFRTKYRELLSGRNKGKHLTTQGEYIVAVNDMVGERFGVNNVLVYAKDSYQNYKITKVVRINLNNETNIETVRGDIYE